MFSRLLLIGSAVLANAGILTLEFPNNDYNPVYRYDTTNNENFYYYNELFADTSVSWQENNTKMILTATIAEYHYPSLPDKMFDYLYFGDSFYDYDFLTVAYSYPGMQAVTINKPLNNIFPFVKSNNLYEKSSFPTSLFIYSMMVVFDAEMNTANDRVMAQNAFRTGVAFTNDTGIVDYFYDLDSTAYNDGLQDGYDAGYDVGYDDGLIDGVDEGYADGVVDGFEDGYDAGFYDGFDDGFEEAAASADGTWLGSLVFGTIGGIVGLLFAISDFEVLGVSIMSIITLFVAIGIIMLLMKVLK